MPEPTDFCPALPEPYEALVRRALAATGIAALDHSIACNHAAAEAEHALRVAVKAQCRALALAKSNLRDAIAEIDGDAWWGLG